MKPSFVGIGAQKCASSWIYDILAGHPQISVSEKKELDFFSYHYEYGYRWYEQQFPDRHGVCSAGEISPSYFHEASVPERVRLYNPNARILVSLRDPVQRALSQHRHLVRIGLVSGPDYRFETALANNPSYLDQGLYAAHLKHWFSFFPREQFHIVLMEDIRTSADAAARAVYRFLDVDEDHVSQALHEKSNPSYVVRSRLADSLIASLRHGARATGMLPAWRTLGDSGLRKLYRTANRKPSEAVIPPVPDEVLASLRSYFRKDILTLESILKRELHDWL